MVLPDRIELSTSPLPTAAVPVHAGAIARLKGLVGGRAGTERLLTRWVHKRVANPPRWVRDVRRVWGVASEVRKPWTKAIELAAVPEDTIMYALRHTSIVRGLIAGPPVRLIAALHDTSVAMIEKHYLERAFRPWPLQCFGFDLRCSPHVQLRYARRGVA
jgi:hypothetical protein